MCDDRKCSELKRQKKLQYSQVVGRQAGRYRCTERNYQITFFQLFSSCFPPSTHILHRSFFTELCALTFLILYCTLFIYCGMYINICSFASFTSSVDDIHSCLDGYLFSFFSFLYTFFHALTDRPPVVKKSSYHRRISIVFHLINFFLYSMIAHEKLKHNKYYSTLPKKI